LLVEVSPDLMNRGYEKETIPSPGSPPDRACQMAGEPLESEENSTSIDRCCVCTSIMIP
jgi:hypothetical protein